MVYTCRQATKESARGALHARAGDTRKVVLMYPKSNNTRDNERTILTDDELAAIEQRADAATPGGWWIESENSDKNSWHVFYEDVSGGSPGAYAAIAFDLYLCPDADATFIAASRTDIPRLLASHRALVAEVERLQSGIEYIRDDLCGIERQTDDTTTLHVVTDAMTRLLEGLRIDNYTETDAADA